MNLHESNRRNKFLFGVDISNHQQVTDWDQLVDKIDFIVIRAGHVGSSFGGDKNKGDPKLNEYKLSVRTKDVIVGYYWFLYNIYNPEDEAQLFHNNLNDIHEDEIIFVDIETDYGASEVILRRFIDKTEDLFNRKCHIYTTDVYLKKHHWILNLLSEDRHLWLGKHNLKPFKSLKHNAILHQYAIGFKEGIKGVVDLDAFNGNREELMKLSE